MLDSYGSDVSTFVADGEDGFGLDPLMAEITGPRVVLEACARRLMTPRGSLLSAPDYGYDLLGKLSGRMSALARERIGSDISAELLRDATTGLPYKVDKAKLLAEYGEGVAALRQLAPESQDVIFIDPPFDGGLFETALAAAAAALSARGAIYLEAPTAWTDALLEPMNLVVFRYLKAGAVHAHVLHKALPPEVTSTPQPMS